ncbi:hypothetical protein IFM89_023778, partial [Coptis chinensis]
MVQHWCDEMLLPLGGGSQEGFIRWPRVFSFEYLACPSAFFLLLDNLEVLLMGGGEGMGPVKKTAKALGDALFDESMGRPIGQVVVICGRNKSLSSILIALGDLAVECGWVRLADIQEEIISICGAAHIPVIWATH